MDRHPAGAFAEDRHIRRVAIKGGNIGPHPFERGNLIEEAEIAAETLCLERRMREEAEAAEPIVQADEHDAIAREIFARVDRRRTAAVHETAAMDPHHHRALVARFYLRRFPDIKVKTVLRRSCRDRRCIRGKGSLGAVRREAGCTAFAGPRRDRLRRAPPVRPDRRSRIGNALVGGNIACGDAADPAGFRRDALRSRGCREKQKRRQNRCGPHPHQSFQLLAARRTVTGSPSFSAFSPSAKL